LPTIVKKFSHIPAFPEKWPAGYLARARALGDGSPLLRLGTATEEEELPDPGALADPVGEGALSPVPYLVRKYVDRALFIATGRCLFHCRFCFRRGAGLYDEPDPGAGEALAAAHFVAANPEIDEVIFSGGDPLTLPDDRLDKLLALFGQINTVRRLRIHTRAPVVAPERVSTGLLKVFDAAPYPLTVVIHVAHPDELTGKVLMAIEAIERAIHSVQSQTVLLKGVNDDAVVLEQLFSRLRDHAVVPKYLHHPDRAHGTGDFTLSLEHGTNVCQQYRILAGSRATPYVIDLPNGCGKVPVQELEVVGKKQLSGKTLLRYRWSRPPGWKSILPDTEYEWWDRPS